MAILVTRKKVHRLKEGGLKYWVDCTSSNVHIYFAMNTINLSYKFKNPFDKSFLFLSAQTVADDKDLNFYFSRKQILNPFKQERKMIDVCIMSPVAWTI